MSADSLSTSETLQAEVATLQKEKAIANAEIERLRIELEWFTSCRHSMRVTSPLTEVTFTEWKPNGTTDNCRWWQSWCPCCKRPLDFTMYDSSYDIGEYKPEYNQVSDAGTELQHEQEIAQCSAVPSSEASARYAYVAALWGGSPGFALGALVLGHALRRSGTTHDLLLLHTNEFPTSTLELLAEIWQLQNVEYIDGNEALFWKKGNRFDGVFTKLHVLGLTDYNKVLMLDLDLAIFDCLDELFDLPAPAAMRRGMGFYKHGSRIDGRSFFRGEYENWLQGGGINAGVMLLRPDATLYTRSLYEVRTPTHPEHIPGSGPEQDYLSRFFAPWWTHISILYNCQLHHIFYSLEAAVSSITGISPKDEFADVGRTTNALITSSDEDLGYVVEPVTAAVGSTLSEIKTSAGSVTDSEGQDAPQRPEPWTPMRLSLNPDMIHVVHFSGELKMWDRDYLGSEKDDDFVIRLLDNISWHGVPLWIDQTAENAKYAEYGVCLRNGLMEPIDPRGLPVADMIKQGRSQILGVTLKATVQWRKDMETLIGIYSDCPKFEALLKAIHEPNEVARACKDEINIPTTAYDPIECENRVEVYWYGNKAWYWATVKSVLGDGAYSVIFDEYDSEEMKIWTSGADIRLLKSFHVAT